MARGQPFSHSFRLGCQGTRDTKYSLPVEVTVWVGFLRKLWTWLPSGAQGIFSIDHSSAIVMVLFPLHH